MAAKIAAQCVHEMIEGNNYSLDACLAYHLRCYDAFGFEFWSSSICAHVIYNIPIALGTAIINYNYIYIYIYIYSYVLRLYIHT